MNQFLSRILLFIGVMLGVFGLSFAGYLNALDPGLGLHAKTVWAAFGGSLLLGLAAWRFPLKAKFTMFALIISLLCAELLLQAAGWLGVVPGVNTRLHVPFGRVYWTSEGHSNSIRNRFGWNYPRFDTSASHRIAFIGDSQVEATEVSCRSNQAAGLQALLKSPDWAVLGLGTRGTCAAHYIEVLEYAWRHFQPQDAIIVIFLGNDITEASPLLNGYPADQFLYYDLNPDGGLTLNPASAHPRQVLNRALEINHSSLLVSLPMILVSHCMIMQMAASFRDTLALHRRQAQFAQRAAMLQAREGAEYQRLGLNPAPFALNPDPEAKRAMAVLLAEIRRCHDICQSHGMKMHLVTLPAFPRVFFDSQHGSNWTMQIGDYDYLAPERQIVAFSATNGIPTLALGEYIRRKNLSVDEVRALYYSNGVGHLTEKGHHLCAEAIYETFYRN